MIITKSVFENMINSPVRSLRGRVEIFEGSTLALVCGCHDNLKSFTVERVGEEGKFFGFGVCQKLNTHLLDPKRELNITTAHNLEVEFGVGSDYVYPCPNFYVTEVNRDEKTNELSITAYDALYKAKEHTVSELQIGKSYTIEQFLSACAALLGLPHTIIGVDTPSFTTYYPTGANFEGTETIREALDDIAEATQTIYYINSDWKLTFKRLDKDGVPVATIDKEKYIELDSKTNRRLVEVAHVTELSDNVSAKLSVSGTTQYVRDNAFWELRDDIAVLVDDALAAIGGITINQFECNWRGNYLLEIGDKIEFVTKDDNTVVSYILDDTMEFNGSLSGKTRWNYSDNNSETESNPTSIGDAIKQTYARVDKANKQINLVASETDANSSAISALQINTTSISSSVTALGQKTDEAIEEINGDIANLSTKVEQTAEDIKISVKNDIQEEGVNQVTTETGFTFNKEGLTVSKDNSTITTTITEDGMIVKRENTPVLTADNTGVKAMNLHATTYLFVGVNSRFQDYANNTRTGCFWIGK